MTFTFVTIPIYNAIIIGLSSLGGLIGTFICLLLLCNITYNFYKSVQEVKRKKSDSKKQDVDILFLIYSSFTMLSCIFYAFIRSNVITRIQIQTFTKSQCIIGWFGGFTFGVFSKIMLYILFIHRIKTVFDNSAYGYPPWVYRAGFIWCGIFIIFYIAVRYYILFTEWNFNLELNQDTNIIFCSTPFGPNRSFTLIYSLVTVIWELLTNIMLLYLFIKQLYSLRQTIISSQLKSTMNVFHIEDGRHSVRRTLYKTKSILFKEILDKYQDDEYTVNSSMKTAIKLHQLMKKQLILVTFAVASTIIFYIVNVIFEGTTILITWDLSMNTICMWLVFKTAEKYWLFCTKYGPCCCCYRSCKCQNNDKYIEKRKSHHAVVHTVDMDQEKDISNDVEMQKVIVLDDNQ